MVSAKPLIVLVGETASGKTELGIRLAEAFNGEIICADSATVRRRADIGSAKPTPEEQARVKHHLIDLVNPDEPFSAAQFKKLAEAVIDDITARGKLPMIVGGTGLYVDSLLYDYQFLQPADPALRQRLGAMSLEQLQVAAHNLQLDLSQVDAKNPRRLVRFIETNGHKPSRQSLRQNTLLLGLQPDRTQLKVRIEARVDKQLADGLETEVKTLVDQFGWDSEALKAIAYAQWRGYFEGQKSLEMVRTDIVRANLDYAKRQRTWFRRNKSIQWLTTPVKWPDVVALVSAFLDAKAS